MATTPIQPQGLPSPAKAGPPAAGREAATRPAPAARPHGAAPSRPAGSLELQLARIFARHAMQAQRQPETALAPAASPRQTRGGNLDILA